MTETEQAQHIGALLAPEMDRLREAMEKAMPERQAELAKIHEARKQRYFEDLLEKANLPKRHAEAQGIDRSGEWGRKESLLISKFRSGFLIALIGSRGPGKTQLGVELIRHFTRAHQRQCYFCSATQFFMAVKASYKHESESEEEVINRFAGYGLLVIDEIGQRSETEWENRLLYELLNRRYNAVKDTLLISNQDEQTLKGALGPSLASRMGETGGIIECNWKSYRNQ